MKIEKTEISLYLGSSIAAVRRNEAYFQSPLHMHPEIELVYIKESHGKRIIGNNIARFEAGDMVFLGSNVPHVWLNDEEYYQEEIQLKAKAIVVYFQKEIFGPLFYEMQESKKILQLFENSQRGIVIRGNTNSVIARKLEKLVPKKGIELVVSLLEILSILSDSQDLEYINPESYRLENENDKKDRLTDVFNYLKKHFRKEISLEEIASVAHVTPTSFCRIFKTKTRKNFIEYLNELRLSEACKMLIETDVSIADIAFECGFKNASNFNKIFKKMYETTPMNYKKTAQTKLVVAK